LHGTFSDVVPAVPIGVPEEATDDLGLVRMLALPWAPEGLATPPDNITLK
jgi:hypothetical protein